MYINTQISIKNTLFTSSRILRGIQIIRKMLSSKFSNIRNGVLELKSPVHIVSESRGCEWSELDGRKNMENLVSNI